MAEDDAVARWVSLESFKRELLPPDTTIALATAVWCCVYAPQTVADLIATLPLRLQGLAASAKRR